MAQAQNKPAKLKIGSRIRIKKQTFIEPQNNFSLDVGEVFTVESITATGAAKITKTFATGVTKKAVISKAFYEKA